MTIAAALIIAAFVAAVVIAVRSVSAERGAELHDQPRRRIPSARERYAVDTFTLRSASLPPVAG